MTHSKTPRCLAEHNPGVWPYIAVCILDDLHEGKHKDIKDREWESGEQR
jgi:hypothetical protein